VFELTHDSAGTRTRPRPGSRHPQRNCHTRRPRRRALARPVFLHFLPTAQRTARVSRQSPTPVSVQVGAAIALMARQRVVPGKPKEEKLARSRTPSMSVKRSRPAASAMRAALLAGRPWRRRNAPFCKTSECPAADRSRDGSPCLAVSQNLWMTKPVLSLPKRHPPRCRRKTCQEQPVCADVVVADSSPVAAQELALALLPWSTGDKANSRWPRQES